MKSKCVPRGSWFVVRHSSEACELRTTNHKPRTTGFTLIEVVVAIGILMGLSLSLAQMTTLVTKGRQRVERRNMQYHAARVALEKISRDVGMAFLVQVPALKGMNAGAPVLETAFRGSDHGDEDELDFTTLAGHRYLANTRESDQRKVGYKITRVPDADDVKQLVRREATVVEGDVREGGVTTPVVEGVRAFNLRYYDAEKAAWDPDWDSTERVHQGKLPAAVEMTLQLSDPNDPEHDLTFTTVARIRLAPGPLEF